MAKRTPSTPSAKTTKPAAPKEIAKVAPQEAPKTEIAASTPVRKTVAPRKTPTTSVALTHDMIAERAYHIAMSGRGGNQTENWYRAERELKAELGLA